MAVDSTVISKRNARVFLEDGLEKCKSECQARRITRGSEGSSDAVGRRVSSSTSTSQTSLSSLESCPISALEASANATGRLPPEPLAEEDDEYAITVDKIIPADILERHLCAGTVCQSIDASLPAVGRPHNFGIVVPGVYRSSYPQPSNYQFIEALNIKTIVTLVSKDVPEGYKQFIDNHGIGHHVFNMKGTKKEEIPIKTMKSILRLVLDQQHHPLLIHCNHGKHRTGCVVAVVRKLSGWELADIIDEYKLYAEPKIRECDIKYIVGFELSSLSNLFVRESTFQIRVRNFLRATVFSLVVLLIWFVSGSKFTSSKRRMSR